MLLEGIEFSNYACFERQFVPIRDGVNLLVGRNNAGKTALLRGAAVLSAIPWQDRPHVPEETKKFVNQLRGYLREDGGYASFEISVRFRVEQGDPIPVISEADASWRDQLIADHHVTSIYSFTAMPWQSEDQVVLASARLLVDDRSFEFLSSTGSGIVLRTFDKAFKETGGGPISKGGRVVTGPGGRISWTPVPALDYFKPMNLFGDSRYVDAHRIVSPWVQVQTAENLPNDAANLAVFLQTLRGNRARAFREIERTVTEIFPDIVSVNPASQNNQVAITLSRRDSERDIPLTHSGTGVEQVLAIATFAVTAKSGAILFLDEPHSFLHPTAERQLIQFLQQDSKHRYVVGTHSAVFINSVGPDRITYVQSPGTPYKSDPSQSEIGRLLLDLGYRNSDILFYDSLVVVEGPSDRAILPILLSAAGVNSQAVAGLGFPLLEGTPPATKDLQAAIIHYEKLIAALSRGKMSRIYLIDGDRSPADRDLLARMRKGDGSESVPVRFLPRMEIENYLIEPEAINRALTKEASLLGLVLNTTADGVATRIDELLAATDPKLYPRGRQKDPRRDAKGSVLLERLYDSFEHMVYDKEHSGSLIAAYITLKNQPVLAELRSVLADVLPKEQAASAQSN